MTIETIGKETTLGQLAVAHPELIPWLQEQDIDFCCGGNQTVGELCQTRGIAFEEFAATAATRETVSREAGDRVVPSWEPGQEEALIAYILDRFHTGHRRDFPVLESLMEKVGQTHGEKLPALAELAELLDALIADVEPHMQKEERVLFPLIYRMLGLDYDGPEPPAIHPMMPMGVMRNEHEHVGGLLKSMTALTDGYTPPEWACASMKALYAGLASFDAELRLHIHLENNALFPMVEDRLMASAEER